MWNRSSERSSTKGSNMRPESRGRSATVLDRLSTIDLSSTFNFNPASNAIIPLRYVRLTAGERVHPSGELVLAESSASRSVPVASPSVPSR